MNVPILMYHQVTATPPSGFARYSVAPAQFLWHMRWLWLRGFTTLSLDDLMICRAGQRPWPPRPVIITIDDGYDAAVRAALDVLPRFGFTATAFLVAGVIGRVSTWDAGVAVPVASWSAAREMAAAGFTCGSHTVTHPRLVDLSPDACRHELRDARRRLEDGLGAPVRHLAYPFGSVNETVRRLAAEAGYTTACTVTRGLSTDADDPLLLQRVHILGHDSFLDFVCRLRTARPLGEMVTARLRRMAGKRAAPAP